MWTATIPGRSRLRRPIIRVERTALPEVMIVEPRIFSDERGFFFESFNERSFADATGDTVTFVQDNHSRSARGVLRGLHYQQPEPQGKLVRVVKGVVWDVAVDLRRSSPTFTKWVGVELTEENHLQLWIPEGFGHGFLAMSETADLLYKTTRRYHGEYDRAIAWDDPEIGIEWPLDGAPILSEKDSEAPRLAAAVLFD